MQQTQLLKGYGVAFLANVFVFSVLYGLIPGLRDSFTQEGMVLENLTAILAFNSFLVGLFFVLQRRKQTLQKQSRNKQSYKKSGQKLYALLPVLGLLLFLDELSFGEDIFGIEFFTLGGMKIDSLHDFISLFYKKAIIPVGGRDGLWYGVVGVIAITSFAVLIRFVHLHRHRFKRAELQQTLNRLNQTYPPLIFVAIAIGLGLLATTVDLRIVQFKGAKFLEELFEMNAALALLLACFAIKIPPTQNHSPFSEQLASRQSAQPVAQSPEQSPEQPLAKPRSQKR
ncbi:MAG: hypothetical protein AAF050_16250 [Cyanobacteria bacterium J06649_5]